MTTQLKASRDYWAEVLGAGGMTAIPRWTLAPESGVSDAEVVLGDDASRSLRHLADSLDVSFEAIALAAHVRVVAALTGEPEVVTGIVVAAGADPVPCRLVTDRREWQQLVAEAERSLAQAQQHAHYPVADLARELGFGETLFETVFDPFGRNEFEDGAVFALSLTARDGGFALRLAHRTAALDAGAAQRILGYHATALSLLAAGPEADPGAQSLVTADERQFLIEGLSGPKRILPGMRAHEIFEERTRRHPDAVAATFRDQVVTYGALNARANRLARAIRAHGVAAEDVVGVVTERNLDWLAAVLAVMKAGGVYLPVEPHFPGERIAAMLRRSGCTMVLTEPHSTDTLDDALAVVAGVERHYIESLADEQSNGDPKNDMDLAVDVDVDQLAYIYFTSGSTGEPKGAMCEHAGMLNHMFAKIDDLDIGAGQVVAQVAPQCFDISLWQLISALLVGGETLLIDQETILDVERFVDTIVDGRVAVLQVVPSYLEVILSYLDQHPRSLPDLRYVSVTGEALTKELTERWFAAMPHIKLVNAYGLTETSDDTNHEVMDRPPEGDRVPLGPAVNNAYVYVVDERLEPVPLGAPGEIVFSGICVGRGYINDPERTAMAYMDDPLRPGQRLYRSGDYGRWRPDGKLEFLGRRDAQVKIRGFRIEIGDIENALLRIPGVRNGAVVVAEGSDASKHLVAFYSSDRDVSDRELHRELSGSLPPYMVPGTFHRKDELPLTGNGKINRKLLRIEAAERLVADAPVDREPPQTQTEHKLVAVWSQLLGVAEDQIGRSDSFFERGGTSLTAVRLAVALNREVSLKDITRFPILAELAALLDGRTERDAGLLQVMVEPVDERADVMVCFPYAGGNAVNFQPLASELGKHGIGVYAVELPGHDLAAEREAFAPLSAVVDQVVDEVVELGPRRIMVWGHSSGAAFAVEAVRRLEKEGVDVHWLFIGAQRLGTATGRRAATTAMGERSNPAIAAGLISSGGYADPHELDGHRLEHIGAAFRHDFAGANEYLAAAIERPWPHKLATPVTVVLAADDAVAAGADDAGGWDLLAESVDRCELADGGHYFLRTRPAATAGVVLGRTTTMTTPIAATP